MTVSCVCGATWTGTKIEHCTARGCHQSFSGTRLGDRHRVGPHDGGRRCLTVDEMTAKGWRQVPLTATGHMVWRDRPRTDDDMARIAQTAQQTARENESEGLPAPDGTIHTPSIPTT